MKLRQFDLYDCGGKSKANKVLIPLILSRKFRVGAIHELPLL
jgi:hypothetical protein